MIPLLILRGIQERDTPAHPVFAKRVQQRHLRVEFREVSLTKFRPARRLML